MRRKIKTYLNCLMIGVIGLLPLKLSAQQLKISARFDSTTIQIGDQIRWHVEVEQPASAKVKMPVFADTLAGKIEIVKVFPADTSKRDGKLIIKQDLLVTSFDSGYHQVPPIAFPYQVAQLKDTLRTTSMYLNVNTLPVDTTKEIHDIKAPLGVPFSLLDYWQYIAGFFGLVLIGFAVWFIIKIRRKEPLFGQVKAIDPPHVIALRQLDALRAEKLWQSDKSKVYYTRLTEVIRTYIERRFEITALEMTSDEIISALKSINIDDFSSIELLQKLFSTADIVKFAKGQPLPDENEVNLLNAYQFVNNTKVVVSAITETVEENELKESEDASKSAEIN